MPALHATRSPVTAEHVGDVLHVHLGVDPLAVRLPELTETLVSRSFMPEKYKRMYLRIVKERMARFSRFTR